MTPIDSAGNPVLVPSTYCTWCGAPTGTGGQCPNECDAPTVSFALAGSESEVASLGARIKKLEGLAATYAADAERLDGLWAAEHARVKELEERLAAAKRLLRNLLDESGVLGHSIEYCRLRRRLACACAGCHAVAFLRGEP